MVLVTESNYLPTHQGLGGLKNERAGCFLWGKKRTVYIIQTNHVLQYGPEKISATIRPTCFTKNNLLVHMYIMEASFWRRLWTCRQTEYWMNEWMNEYVYSQKHNYISYSTFTITTVQLHVSAINVGHLQVVHETPYDKLYLHVSWGTVCGVGWVRDLVLCL